MEDAHALSFISIELLLTSTTVLPIDNPWIPYQLRHDLPHIINGQLLIPINLSDVMILSYLQVNEMLFSPLMLSLLLYLFEG